MTNLPEADMPYQAETDTIVVRPGKSSMVPDCSLIYLTRIEDRSAIIDGNNIEFKNKAVYSSIAYLEERFATKQDTLKEYVAVDNHLKIYHENNLIMKMEIAIDPESESKENKQNYINSINFFKTIKDEDALKVYKLMCWYSTIINVGTSFVESLTDPIPLTKEQEDLDEDEQDFFGYS